MDQLTSDEKAELERAAEEYVATKYFPPIYSVRYPRHPSLHTIPNPANFLGY